jgi:hypothetical protein
MVFFFMMRMNKRLKKHSGNKSTSFSASELLAVQALCHQLGSQNALLVQIAWLQITIFAQYSGDEFRWATLLRIRVKTFNSKHIEHRVYPPTAQVGSA